MSPIGYFWLIVTVLMMIVIRQGYRKMNAMADELLTIGRSDRFPAREGGLSSHSSDAGSRRGMEANDVPGAFAAVDRPINEERRHGRQ